VSGPTDIEVSRALNALVTTVNDQRPDGVDQQRWQTIVTGALGGEPHIRVVALAQSALLNDAHGNELARVDRVGDRWVGRRLGAPLSGGYVPK
jgi:hypothetical protein